MMDLFRKHRKIIYWVIIVLVGVPFVFITTDYVPFADRARKYMMGDEYAPVAQVGEIGISGDELRQALDRQIPPNPDQETTDYRALVESGQVDEVLNNLVKARLIEVEANKVDLALKRDYLEESLKKDPSFLDEQGQFDPKAWNDFVRDGRQRGMDWDAVYDSVALSMRQRVAGQRVLASARVRQGELREQFERQNTQVKLKYLTIEPQIEPTDAEIQAHYESNKTQYDIPAQRKVEFVAVPMGTPKPEVLSELAMQARQGRDFQEIAKSAPPALNVQAQPATGWIPMSEALPEQLAFLFMQPGEVMGPVEMPGGFAIMRLEESRVNLETGGREVRASQLFAYPSLSEEEKAARSEQAQNLAKTAADGDLAAAAAQAGLEVKSTDEFSRESASIANVPSEDVPAFAQGVESLEAGKVSEVIRGQKNLYVAKVTELTPAVPQPLEAVRDRVVQDVIAATKQSPEYQAQVAQLAKEIPQKAKSLEEVQGLYPNLKGEVKEVGPFDVQTYSFSSGPFWNVEQVVEEALKAGEGKITGPVNDFLGGQHLVQLVEKTPPSEQAWQEEFPKAKEQLRKQLLARRQAERFQDYLDYLLQRADVSITRNEAAIRSALRLDEPVEGEAASGEGTAEAAQSEAPASTTETSAPPVDVAPPPPAPTAPAA